MAGRGCGPIQLNEDVLGAPVDGHLALLGANLGDVDVELTDEVVFEWLL